MSADIPSIDSLKRAKLINIFAFCVAEASELDGAPVDVSSLEALGENARPISDLASIAVDTPVLFIDAGYRLDWGDVAVGEYFENWSHVVMRWMSGGGLNPGLLAQIRDSVPSLSNGVCVLMFV